MVYSVNHPLLEHVNCTWFHLKTTINRVGGSQSLHAGQVHGFLAHHKNLQAPNNNGVDTPFAYDTFVQAFNSTNTFLFKSARKGEDGQIAKGTDINEAAFDVGDSALSNLSTAIKMVAIQLWNSREAEEHWECMKLNCSVVDNVFVRHVVRGHCGCSRNCGGHHVSYDRTPNPYAQIPQQAQQVIEDVLTAVKDYVPPAQYTPAVMTPAPTAQVVDLSLTLAPTTPLTPVALTPNPPVSGAASSAINEIGGILGH
ncbi:hypothetical protein C0989_002849 [Termitomyces sp. Mn162]|nr:hypothetical protein C0989_002849 [Termitomyces sp. Mn162]